MTERDLAYWLQGYFELREEQQPLTAKQQAVILKHIDLVHEETHASALTTHIAALVQRGQTNAVRAILDAHFEHVIDPQSKGEQSHLNTLSGHLVTRC